jgi:threonine synthase
MGFYIEPTSALALAGFLQMKTEIGDKEIVVLPLTGSGLKGHPSYN